MKSGNLVNMLEKINISEYVEKVIEWCGGYFWSSDTLYQLGIIFSAFFVSWFIARILKTQIKPVIDKKSLPAKVKNVIENLYKLIWPSIALILIFITMQFTQTLFSSEQELIDVILKLLMAWIFIRLIAQIIGNKFVRNVFALTIWAVAALSIFGVLDETMHTLDALGVNIGNFRLSALIVLKAIFSVFILLYLALFASSFIERRIFKTKGLTRSSQVLIAKISRVTLVVFALLIAITSSGVDLSLFAVFGGAIGLGIGFGLQKGISNLFSGMLLLMDQSIKPGDVIEMDNGTFGWVNNMAARYTEIVTRDNKSFLIPNEELITQRVVNWSHGNTLIRLEVEFGVSYEHNPHEIRDIACEAIRDCDERICKDPAPVCHFVEFADSSLNFKLRFWIKDAEKGVTNIRGSAMLALWDSFQENNINIPYPHRDIYVHDVKKKA